MISKLHRIRGFTLIELLIVVAIIAILAAIAIPNFLEAQTRSKVSRSKADMRAVATAVEAYAVDHNKYPFYFSPIDEDFPTYDRSSPGSLAATRFEFRVPITITTPVAYMTSLLVDPFPNLNSPDVEEHSTHPFHYCNDQDFSANPGAGAGLDQFPVRGIFTMVATSSNAAAPYTNGSALWMLLSHGPDTDHDNPDEALDARFYDPTNGTVSSGDIYYFGPGLGFGK